MSYTLSYLLKGRCLATRLLHSLPGILVLVAAMPAEAVTWQQPTAEELSMTAATDAPGAPAVYLFREEIADDTLHYHSLYARLKVLTEEGKKYADVEMPFYDSTHYRIDDIQGRTIHSDGTVIPFTGKPNDRLVAASREYAIHKKVFSLPDVQVGSIIEYRYSLRYDDNYADAPLWQIQQEIPVRSTHYRFVPTSHELNVGHGESVTGNLNYTPQIPPGVKVEYVPSSHAFDLRMQNVPRLPTEDYMPPMGSLSYRVTFYYTNAQKSDDYWKDEGKYWSKDIDRFASPSKLVTGAVRGLVQPSDSAEQKVVKIYDYLMTFENTSFTRKHSAAEDKSEGIKIRTADDVLTPMRGNDDEITLLFIAMVRAAGLKAYAMRVANRDTALFLPTFLSMYQLDDDLAIVEIDGKEQFFDPGQRYCPFGDLHWKHTMVGGIRQSDHGAVVAQTPGMGYKSTTVLRTAELKLGSDGQLSGYIRINMTGAEALRWRQEALRGDIEEVKKTYQDELQANLPAGVEVKTNHFLGMTDYKSLLMAQLDVSGSLGTASAKHIFLPSCFFEGGARPLFAHEKRELPVDLHFPFASKDQIDVKFPPSFAAESIPKDAEIPWPKEGLLVSKYSVSGDVYTQTRTVVVSNSIFMVDDYAGLRDFYQKMNAQDQQQVILKAAAVTPSVGTAQ